MSPKNNPPKCAKFETFLSSFSHWHVRERIFIKMDSAKSRGVIGPENILFLRRVRGSFSPEILQAGAVKGLKQNKNQPSLFQSNDE